MNKLFTFIYDIFLELKINAMAWTSAAQNFHHLVPALSLYFKLSQASAAQTRREHSFYQSRDFWCYDFSNFLTPSSVIGILWTLNFPNPRVRNFTANFIHSVGKHTFALMNT